ncbi:nonsense-mediated mRNA decay factor SMG5 [Hetaerina americana]|uniref:nonsense-mediated mRNA decay factor SMG5 n=1 Tax=Hetaerina americana TaxID=62018 RepID=UPI003A7F1777
MKKFYNPITDGRAENVDLTKRLYRTISEAVRYLDDQQGKAKTCADLFLPHMETHRARLREYCERLIFSDPVGYGRKGEELLWRKAYYEALTSAKRLRKGNAWSVEDIAYLQKHLSAGVGNYHHLIFRMQIEYKLDLRGIIDFPLVVDVGGLSKGKSSVGKLPEVSGMEWARQAVHRCLVYLGDLSRYLSDLHPCWDVTLSTRYYFQALNFNPEVGMPHNQLGTLAATQNHSVDASYHYMRCLVCPQSFEGAEGNLQRMLEKNNAWLDAHLLKLAENLSQGENQPTVSHEDQIHCCVARFLNLIGAWFFDKMPVVDMNQLCHQTLMDFQQCITFSKSKESDLKISEDEMNVDQLSNMRNGMSVAGDKENPHYLSDEIVFRMMVMLLMCLDRMQKNGSQNASAVVAFTLAMFSLLIQHVLQCIQDAVPPQSPDEVPSPVNWTDSSEKTVTENGGSHRSSTDERVKMVNGTGKHGKCKKKSSLSKLRRRRRRRIRKNSSDSDASDVDSHEGSSSSEEGDSDGSESEGLEEEEEVVQSSDDEEEEDSSLAVSETLKGEAESNGKAESDAADERKGPSEDVWRLVLDLLMGNGEDGEVRFVGAVKVCSDWLRGDGSVISACARSSPLLLQRVIKLANLVNVDVSVLADTGSDGIEHFKLQDIREISEKVPLPEDVLLKGIPIFKGMQDTLDWDYLRHHSMNSLEEAIIRAHKLVNFAHYLSAIKDTAVTYDAERRKFLIELNVPETEESKSTELSETKPVPDVAEGVSGGGGIGGGGGGGGQGGGGGGGSGGHRGGHKGGRGGRGGRGGGGGGHSRRQLMQNMGQLWLRAEVNDLETRVRRRGAFFSPYLVVDADALIYRMSLVKQLVNAKKFIVIIPTVVVSALDELKRDSARARETIRWLESQFQRGNRFLRAQRGHERMSLPLIKYPKKKDKEASLYFQVVECCYYLSKQQGVHEPDTPLVTLLTGTAAAAAEAANDGSGDAGPVAPAPKGFSPVGIAQSAGINLEPIDAFHTKWKTSSKSHG